MKGLKGKVALVTGGGRGIGRAISIRLAEEEMHVAICDLTDPASKGAAEDVVVEIRRLGGRSIAVGADVGDWRQVEEMERTISNQLGDPYLLVNNAAVTELTPFLELTEEAWNRTLRTNLTGMFITCRVFSQRMVQRRSGKIVNVSSLAGIRAGHGLAHYSASKAGVLMLTQTLALELGPYNINVNAVVPGVIPTQVNEHLLADPKIREKVIAAIPLGRIGTPSDIAATVAFLASEDARHINGHQLIVDGGMHVQTG